MTVRKEGALLASFADGGIRLDRDVTVAAASTLNATTADFAQLLVGSTAASGAFNSSSSVTANLEVVSNLRVEAPLVRCDPTASVLTWSRLSGPSAALFPRLLGLGARICRATSPRNAAAARALVRPARPGNSRRAIW